MTWMDLAMIRNERAAVLSVVGDGAVDYDELCARVAGIIGSKFRAVLAVRRLVTSGDIVLCEGS